MAAFTFGTDWRCRSENRSRGGRSPQVVPLSGRCNCLCWNIVAAVSACCSLLPALPFDCAPWVDGFVARGEAGDGYFLLLYCLWGFGLRISAAPLRKRLPGPFSAQLQIGSVSDLFGLFFRFQRRGRPAQSETHGSYRRDGVCCLELRKTGRQNGHDAIFGNCLYAGGALCRYAGFPDFRNTHLCLDSITFTGQNPIPGKRPVLRTGPSFPAGTAPAGCSSVTAVRRAAGWHAFVP